MSNEIQEQDLARLRDLVDDDFMGFRVEEESFQEVDSSEEVWSILAEVEVMDGWLGFTDRVEVLCEKTTLGNRKDILLDAELRLDETRSLHLHHEGGRFQLRWLKRVDSEHAWGRVRELFVANKADGKNRKGTGLMRYEVSWELHEDVFGEMAMQPMRARFAGFITEEN